MRNIEAMDSSDVGQSQLNGPSNQRELDYMTTEVVSSVKATALALNDALAFRDLGEARPHHLALAMAVIELSQDAGLPALWTHDDPTVALLRAAAKICQTHPEAASSAAAELVTCLADSHGQA